MVLSLSDCQVFPYLAIKLMAKKLSCCPCWSQYSKTPIYGHSCDFNQLDSNETQIEQYRKGPTSKSSNIHLKGDTSITS